jgi:Zn-dependent M28 family amino/carboxypeptidase
VAPSIGIRHDSILGYDRPPYIGHLERLSGAAHSVPRVPPLAVAARCAGPRPPRAKPKHKIRFLWFGGEEDGLVGSQYYAKQLSEEEVSRIDVSRIDVIIDTDMIASPNYARLVYDGDGSELGSAGPEDSGTVEAVFKRYFARRGMATIPQAFDGRSDYAGFINRGIPAGGIFAGAEHPKTAEEVALFGGVEGEQLDPCDHEACDNLATVTGQPPAETMNVRLRGRPDAGEPRHRPAAGRLAARERPEVVARDVGRGHPRGLVLRADPPRPAAARGGDAHARPQARARVRAARAPDGPLA